jgi:hypothetical protein
MMSVGLNSRIGVKKTRAFRGFDYAVIREHERNCTQISLEVRRMSSLIRRSNKNNVEAIET